MGTSTQVPHSGCTASFASNPTLVRIRDLIYTEAGIFYSDNKLHTLEERCISRMKEAGATSLRTYYEVLATSRNSELVNLLNRITVGETCFFRNQPSWMRCARSCCPKSWKHRRKAQCRRFGYGARVAQLGKNLTR
jgi:chemotaxis methyl-accepting protein methylase